MLTERSDILHILFIVTLETGVFLGVKGAPETGFMMEWPQVPSLSNEALVDMARPPSFPSFCCRVLH